MTIGPAASIVSLDKVTPPEITKTGESQQIDARRSDAPRRSYLIATTQTHIH